MEAITKSQIIRLHTLLSKTGLTEQKRDLIYHFSGARTSITRELTYDEAQLIIEHLLDADPSQKMVRKVFALAYECGIIHDGDEIGKKINKAALDGWLTRNSYLHKPLNEYKPNELPKLVSQLTMVLKHDTKAKENRQAKDKVKDLLVELGIETK